METYYTFTCSKCNKIYQKTARESYENRIKNTKPFCSKACSASYHNQQQELSCTQCSKSFFRNKFEIKKVKNTFCSSSCAATYNNSHKTTGSCRSKLEIYIEQELSKLFPTLDILFNNKSVINSELDIYIPSLKLAFELNGIFHYEPIYGPDKLSQIQNNDNRKYQACLEQDIEFCIIDTSQQKYFKVQTSQKYLDIISNIIKHKM